MDSGSVQLNVMLSKEISGEHINHSSMDVQVGVEQPAILKLQSITFSVFMAI